MKMTGGDDGLDFHELVHHAEGQGLHIAARSIGRHHGRYLHHHGLILLSHRLTGPQSLSILAHELGHWHFGDNDPEGIHTPEVEARAWRYGAALLISEVEYAMAQRLAGSTHRGAVAAELGVTRQLLDSWRPGTSTQLAERTPARERLRLAQ